MMKRIKTVATVVTLGFFVVALISEGKAQSIDELKNTIKQLEAKNSALESKVKTLQKGKNKSAVEAEETIKQLQEEFDELWSEFEDYKNVEKERAKVEENSKLAKINIKDPVFLEYLLRYCDMDNDGILTQWDAEHTYVIDFGKDKSLLKKLDNSKEVNNLEGLDYFVNLKRLVCSGNAIPQIDLSKNENLETLIANGCELKLLDVSKNVNLIKLECNNNLLYTIDLKNNLNLQELDISKNKMAIIDMSSCTKLKKFNCSGNALTDLNVSNNIELQTIDCSYNKIGTLSFSKNTSLDNINCSNNKLTEVDVKNGIDIKYIDCSKNKDLEFVYFSKGCRIFSDKRDPKTYFK